MIRVDCAQGTPEWHAARLGIPTASNFSKLITAGGKLSTQCDAYAHKLIAEQFLGMPVELESTGFMQRGSLEEKSAREYYEMQTGVDVELVGFCLRDDRRVGCSPDGLVGDDGLLEIKVPAPATHIGYLLDSNGIGYKAQVQGQLWITGRQWIDTVSYNALMPAAIVRQERDEAYIAMLDRVVAQFLSYIDESKLKLARFGMFPLQLVKEDAAA